MIKVRENFSVPSDPRTVWSVVSDPQAVVGCVPGASLGEQQEDGSFDAAAAVKFGPVGVTLRARVTLVTDDAAMVGHVTARGRDNQGGTRVSSTMTFKVTGEGDSASNVDIEGEVEISGRLASVIEGGAPIVVKRMSSEFAQGLARRCASAAPATAGNQLEREGNAT
jgi:carbon monoxide dehydrogenase subunit G